MQAQGSSSEPTEGSAAEESTAAARVLIADPDPLARRVVAEAITKTSRYVVVAEASAGEDAVERAQHHKPDIVLLELDLVGLDGINVTRQIFQTAPEVTVVILSRKEDENVQLEALAAGASGFIHKAVELEKVVEAIDAVLRGEIVVPPKTMMRLIERLRMLPAGGWGMRPVISPLTQREWEILDLMSQDLDTHQMAETLVVSEETIYSHVKHILRKLHVHSRKEAVKAARALREATAGIGLVEHAEQTGRRRHARGDGDLQGNPRDARAAAPRSAPPA